MNTADGNQHFFNWQPTLGPGGSWYKHSIPAPVACSTVGGQVVSASFETTLTTRFITGPSAAGVFPTTLDTDASAI